MSDRFKAALEAFLDRWGRKFDYYASYPSRVVLQNDDGTLDLVPDDVRNDRGELVKRFPQVSRVTMRLPFPGVEVRVKKDSRVLLAFEAGDPARPVATLWELASLEEIKVTASVKVVVDAPLVELGGEGGIGVSRTGDIVEVILPPTVPIAGTLSGEPFAGVLTFAARAIGFIQGSSTHVKAK